MPRVNNLTKNKPTNDPPELTGKSDVETVEKPIEKEPTPEISPEVALLMEQNRVLMEKLNALTEEKEEPVKGDGKPVLNPKRPIAYQRTLGGSWKEQDGHKFSQKDEYMGEV